MSGVRFPWSNLKTSSDKPNLSNLISKWAELVWNLKQKALESIYRLSLTHVIVLSILPRYQHPWNNGTIPQNRDFVCRFPFITMQNFYRWGVAASCWLHSLDLPDVTVNISCVLILNEWWVTQDAIIIRTNLTILYVPLHSQVEPSSRWIYRKRPVQTVFPWIFGAYAERH